MLKYELHSRLFIKTLMTYIVIMMVPIFIFSILSYNNSIQKIKTAAIIQCDQEAKKIISLVDERLLNIQTLSSRVNMLSWVWRLYTEADIFNNDYGAVRKKEIVDDLRILIDDKGLVSNFILLFPKKNIAISLSGWFEIDSFFNYLGESKEILEIKSSLTRKYNFAVPYADEMDIRNHSVILLIHSVDNINEPRAQVIILIEAEKIKQFIKSISPDSMCSLEIYNMKNERIISVQGNGNVKSENVFTTTVPSNAFGWRFNITFDASFTKEHQNEILHLIIILLSTLVLGPLAAFLLAYASYSPLKKMMNRIMLDNNGNPSEKKGLNEYSLLENAFSQLKNDKRQMESRMSEYSKYTQNDMMVRLLKGYFYQSEHEELSYYGIDYSNENNFSVLVISIAKNGMKKEEQLEKIMMGGLLIEKILENEAIHYKIIDILEEDIVVILSDCNNKLDSIQINQLSDNMKSALAVIEETETQIWCGKVEQGILGISKSYHNAKETAAISSFTKDVHEKIDMIICFYYPTDWEIQLINNLKMGKEDSVTNILDALRSENEKRLLSGDVLGALCKSINNTISRVAFELNIDWLEAEIEKNKEKFTDKSDLSSNTAAKQWSYIYDMCHMICIRTTYQRQENMDVSRQILEYINQNYTNPGLSLKEIAQDVGISLSAASKAFKNGNGLKFYDYTCRLRMEKAKELLNNSKLTVKDICKTVGYENEFSLRRTFLRYEGISISEYRNSLQ